MKTKTAPVHLFNASAGAGKTYLLVQRYLEKLLGHAQADFFHQMLALTFTNKAVFEMKTRILKALYSFSDSDFNHQKDAMSIQLCENLGISSAQLASKSRQVLKKILHDYAAFDIITLDSFTHRIIRSFSKDLGLAYNFEVELQVDRLLEQTVERLLSKVGKEEEITAILTSYTFQKMEDDLSWNLKEDLLKSAKLLLNENDRIGLAQLGKLDLQRRIKNTTFLEKKFHQVTEELKLLGKLTLDLLRDHGIEKSDFNRGTFYNRFDQLAQGDFTKYDTGKLHENLLEGAGIYKTTTSEDIKATIDDLLPTLLASYESGLELFFRYQLINDIRKQWTPLSLVSRLGLELNELQKEQNSVLLATFNERISKEIINQPAPYIYERLGENYRHYFLDEFQDTSTLQWSNLIPLISSSLESLSQDKTQGSLMVVGDPKQSIYRWRGGDVSQFMGLLQGKSPFQVPTKIDRLPNNYRSNKTIVEFNNKLYTSLIDILEYEENKLVFGDQATQKPTNEEVGYVQLDFFNEEEDEQKQTVDKVIEKIDLAIRQGYSPNDISILVRKSKQAKWITKALASTIYPFMSSESLLPEDSEEVQFLVSILNCWSYPELKAHKKTHLVFLHSHSQSDRQLDDFLFHYLKQPLTQVWNDLGFFYEFNSLKNNNIYVAIEKACFDFGLDDKNPFISNFLDVLFEFTQREQNDLRSFLRFWELQGSKKTLSMPSNYGGIKIMTIHKAKGLEFPVVIFPFADELIYSKITKRVWLNTYEQFAEDFPLAWVNFSKRLENYGPNAKALFYETRKNDELDAWNVFYVATTRAAEQLYIISSQKNCDNPSYAMLLKHFIDYDVNEEASDKLVEWGTQKEYKDIENLKNDAENEFPAKTLKKIKRNPYEDRLLLQFHKNTEDSEARTKGVLIHNLLEKIKYSDDLDGILEEAKYAGLISSHEQEEFHYFFSTLMNHPRLKPYYSSDYEVLNERALLVPKTMVLRPDRVLKNKEEMVVIDYKTGEFRESHVTQLRNYLNWIDQMNDLPLKGLLIYLPKDRKKELEIKEIN